jgi:hypothetical protein
MGVVFSLSSLGVESERREKRVLSFFSLFLCSLRTQGKRKNVSLFFSGSFFCTSSFLPPRERYRLVLLSSSRSEKGQKNTSSGWHDRRLSLTSTLLHWKFVGVASIHQAIPPPFFLPMPLPVPAARRARRWLMGAAVAAAVGTAVAYYAYRW